MALFILLWPGLAVCTGVCSLKQQSHVKYNNVPAVEHNGKLVASGVPADLVALNPADSGHLPGGHSQHLHLGTSAGQQLSIRGKVDVHFKPISHIVNFKPISIRITLKQMEAVASQSVPQPHLIAVVPGSLRLNFENCFVH